MRKQEYHLFKLCLVKCMPTSDDMYIDKNIATVSFNFFLSKNVKENKLSKEYSENYNVYFSVYDINK